jgi:hypothetical protein
MFHSFTRGARLLLLNLASLCLLATSVSTQSDAPGNDLLKGAQLFRPCECLVLASNAGAGAEQGEPQHRGQQPRHSVWRHWTAPTNDLILFKALSQDFAPLVAVYTCQEKTKSCQNVANLRPVPLVGNQKLDAFSFEAKRKTTYYIAVDSADGKTGKFNLGRKRPLCAIPQSLKVAGLVTDADCNKLTQSWDLKCSSSNGADCKPKCVLAADNYKCSNLDTSLSHTITPESIYYDFCPGPRTYTGIGNHPFEDYTATPKPMAPIPIRPPAAKKGK